MSLNNIQLPSHLLAGLYSNVLIETEGQQQIQKPDVPYPQWKSLGANKKNILILVHPEIGNQLPDISLQFLISILKACQLTLADVAIVTLETKDGADYQTITKYFGSKTVLLFNLNALNLGLPLHFPHFQIQRFDQCIYLSAPPLTEIEKDIESKKLLWASLKTLFSL